MKSIRTILPIIVAATLTGCETSPTAKTDVSIQDKNAKTEKKEIIKGKLTLFTKEDVARFAISSIMGQPSKTIEVKNENGIYLLTYLRKTDSEKFSYKIKINDDQIVWANIDGRWRNTKYDEKIKFEEENEKLKIIQIFSDNSKDVQVFSVGD